MSTGIESWSSIKYLGAIYPFVGSEVLFIVIAVVIWIVWQVWQFKSENRTYEEQTSKLPGNLPNAISGD